MRSVTLLALLLALNTGCSKKQPPDPGGNPNGKTDPGGDPPRTGMGSPGGDDQVAASRAHWLGQLKSSNQKVKQDAVDELAVWVQTDPETVSNLLELLRDKSTQGRVLPTQINSNREAAAMALLKAGPRGEAALKDKGLAILSEGLTSPAANLRENTIYTLGLLGPLARPLSPDVQKLCTDPEQNVRGAAFDALRAIGVVDVAGLAALLVHMNPDIARLAAEVMVSVREIPDSAIDPLTAALGSEEQVVRTAAAMALASAGPKAAPAANALVEAIKKTEVYTRPYDPARPHQAGPESAYWRALSRMGEPAAVPTAKLLAHDNPLVKAFALQVLGELGTAAKPAADQLKAALKDKYGFVAIEAACALCQLGEGKTEAVSLIKQAMDAPGNVAQLAIEAVPRMGDAGKELIPEAMKKLASDNAFARFAAVGLLGRIPADEAAKYVPELGKLVEDKEKEIRMRVAQVLERLGPIGAPAAEAINAALPREKEELIREQFVEALLTMGSGAKPALLTLLPLASQRTLPTPQRMRVIAAVAVADPASPDVAKALIEAASDPDMDTRIAAADALASLDPLTAEARTKLLNLARTDSKDRVRIAALRAFAKAGPRAKAARCDLEAIAAGPVPEFALRAKVAIAAIDGNPAALAPTIRSALTDRALPVRTAATEALLAIGPKASDLPALMVLLKDRSPDTQAAAARCVGRLGSAAADAVPQLIALLGHKEGDVRVAAATALGEIGPAAQPAISKLRELAGFGSFPDQAAGSTARKALEKLGEKK